MVDHCVFCSQEISWDVNLGLWRTPVDTSCKLTPKNAWIAGRHLTAKQYQKGETSERHRK